MRWFLFLAIPAIVLVLLLKPATEEKQPGSDSPELAFEKYKQAAATEDYNLIFSTLTRESKAYHIGLALYSASYLFSNDPAMEKIFLEHGLVLGQLGETLGERMKGDDEKAFVDAVLSIKDPGTLMNKIADRHKGFEKQLAKSGIVKDDKKPPTANKIISSLTLDNIKIAGDSATAVVKAKAPVTEVPIAFADGIQFRRIKGRWYCHIDPR